MSGGLITVPAPAPLKEKHSEQEKRMKKMSPEQLFVWSAFYIDQGFTIECKSRRDLNQEWHPKVHENFIPEEFEYRAVK